MQTLAILAAFAALAAAPVLSAGPNASASSVEQPEAEPVSGVAENEAPTGNTDAPAAG